MYPISPNPTVRQCRRVGHSNLASVTQINWCDVTLSLVEIAYPQARVEQGSGRSGSLGKQREERKRVCRARNTRCGGASKSDENYWLHEYRIRTPESPLYA